MMNRRFRILALDVDGTLLDSKGTLRPRTAQAVTLAAKAGIRPVLCTGRRYRRARPVALDLGIDAPIVCNSGAIVKNPNDHRTLWRADLDRQVAQEILELFQRHDHPSVSFMDHGLDGHDFLVSDFPTGRLHFDDYVGQNQEFARVVPHEPVRSSSGAASKTFRHPSHDSLFHVCAIGTCEEMLEFEAILLAKLRAKIQTFVQRSSRYLGTMCEVLHHRANKWTAVLSLAEAWGVDPSEICAVGDDMNDVAMIRGAGLGVAMGHAPDEVRAVANLITSGHDDDGVAAFVEDVLLA